MIKYLVLVLSLFACNVQAQVAYDNASSSSVNNAQSLTFSHTTAGTNRCLLVHASVNDSAVTISATYNAVAMTSVATRTLPTDGDTSAMFRLQAPASGANNVVISITGGANRVIVGGAASFTGADQTNCVSNSSTATNTSASPSVTVTSATDEFVLGGVATFNGRTQTQGTGETERWDIAITGQPSGSMSGAGFTQAGAASVVINPTQSASGEWAMIGASVKAAAAAATSSNLRLLGVGK